MKLKYRFKLLHNSGVFGFTNESEISPIWGNDFGVQYDRESNRKFLRKKLPSGVKLVKEDFYKVVNSSFSFRHTLKIERYIQGSGTWQEEYYGYFYRTDCKIDYDSLTIEPKVTTIDEYTEVLEGLDKEFNILDLELPMAQSGIYLTKELILQIYLSGSSKITNYSNGRAWDSDASLTTDNGTLTGTYRFNKHDEFHFCVGLNSSGNDSPLSPDVRGKYYKISDTLFEREDSAYTIERDFVGSLVNWRWAIKDNTDTEVFWATSFFKNVEEQTFQNVSSGTGTEFVKFQRFIVYSRVLCDLETLAGSPTFDLQESDIVERNANYNKVYPIVLPSGLTAHDGSTEHATSFGNYPDGTLKAGRHYTEKTSGSTKYYPVCSTSWGEASFWLNIPTYYSLVELGNAQEYQVKNCYHISEIFKGLLNALGLAITHSNDVEYSRFFYAGLCPLTGVEDINYYVTQKSNMLVGGYSEAAKILKTTLGKELAKLENVFRVFWHIEDGKLVLEHAYFYDNGFSYGSLPGIAIDLTTHINHKLSKLWEYDANKEEFEKVEMPERFQFGWMDKVREEFEGQPIEIRSGFVDKGNVKETRAGEVTTDIDYILSNPQDISRDGVAMFATTTRNNEVYIDSDSPDDLFGVFTVHAFVCYMLADQDYTFGQVQVRAYATNATISKSYQIFVGETDVWEDSLQVASGYLQSPKNTDENGWMTIHLDNELTVNDGQYLFVLVRTPSVISDLRMWHGFDVTSENRKIYTATVWGGTPTLHPFYYNVEPRLLEGDIQICDYEGFPNDGSSRLYQNGKLSYAYLHENYFVYDLPAKNVTINKQEITLADNISRYRTQTVKFPLGEATPDFDGLIKTSQGQGFIQNINVNLSTRVAEAKIKHDTEV